MFQNVTENEVTIDIAENRSAWLNELYAKHPGYKYMSQLEESVFLHGEWLGTRLAEAGADKEERTSICFAAGQRMAMDMNNMAKVVAEIWNRWIRGDIDKPGIELAVKLIDEGGV